MKKRWIVLGILLLLAIVFLGFCRQSVSLAYVPFALLVRLFPGKQNANAELKTGAYWRIQKPTPVALNVVKLDIDREKGQAIFYLQDGSMVQAALAGSDEAQWTQGCPTMAGSTKMEFLKLAEDRLVLGDTTFEHPYMEGICPAPPYTIVLCDGSNGEKCVYFGKEYMTLHVQICDRESSELLPEASLTLETPQGNQVFPGTFQVRLPGDSTFPITVSAPGYLAFQGTIEVNLDVVYILTTNAAGESVTSGFYKFVTREEADILIYLDK